MGKVTPEWCPVCWKLCDFFFFFTKKVQMIVTCVQRGSIKPFITLQVTNQNCRRHINQPWGSILAQKDVQFLTAVCATLAIAASGGEWSWNNSAAQFWYNGRHDSVYIDLCRSCACFMSFVVVPAWNGLTSVTSQHIHGQVSAKHETKLLAESLMEKWLHGTTNIVLT